MIRTAVLLALFAGSFAVNPQCKKLSDDKMKQVFGKKMTNEDFAKMMMNEFAATVNKIPEFEKFVDSKPKCQNECFETVFGESVNTLIGKLGDDIIEEDSQKVAIQAFTGAFRTCFPGPDRSLVLEAMKKITDGMGGRRLADADMVKAPVISSGECPGTKGMGDRDTFMDQAEHLIDKAIEKVVGGDQNIKDFFENVMLECQGECVGKNIEQAVGVNWNMGTLMDNSKVTASIEGAIKSCLPGVPYENVKGFVKQLNDAVDAQTAETSRLYQTSPILDGKAGQKSGMMTLIAAVCGVCALSLGIFAAGLRVGKKLHQRQQANPAARLVEIGDIE